MAEQLEIGMLFPGLVYFFYSQYLLIVCSTLCRFETTNP